jgi:hypothetical protein
MALPSAMNASWTAGKQSHHSMIPANNTRILAGCLGQRDVVETQSSRAAEHAQSIQHLETTAGQQCSAIRLAGTPERSAAQEHQDVPDIMSLQGRSKVMLRS